MRERDEKAVKNGLKMHISSQPYLKRRMMMMKKTPASTFILSKTQESDGVEAFFPRKLKLKQLY